MLNVGKDRSYGMKVVNGADEIESRIRNRPPRISIRDRDGNRYLRAKGDLPSIAVAALTLESVPFPFAVGLAVALTRGDHEAPREVQPR